MEKIRSALNNFHPLVADWFAESIGTPTDLQRLAWPRIAAGEHVLITAPTGSGKTMAAFLWAINGLITGKWPLGRVSVLYVSPLKALNNDIRKNLLGPLSELKAVFARSGEHLPPIGVAVRSGDTPQSERRRMLREHPEILITTPESLNLLLSSHGGRSLLTGIRTVILDEIHAVVGGKRGVHLITGVDRLVPLSGEFQRIALSATVRPLETVARFVGGYRMAGDSLRTDSPSPSGNEKPQDKGAEASSGYSARPVSIVSSSQRKNYKIAVRFPEAAAGWDDRASFWQPFIDEIKEIIERNRSTLVFANSRRLCEKLTHLINEDESQPVAYAHHGSLSREIRAEVERKLKSGELRAIIATSSLELGIDIGALDEVVLLQSPPSLSSAIQRIGRAGHRVGEASRGTLIPTEPRDILHAAVLSGGVLGQDIEAVRPVIAPLDVLAQIIVSMTGVETWNLDQLYAAIRASYPYRTLTRGQFDLVVEMLAGRYAGGRLRELKPRIAVDRLENTATARKGALQAVYFSGGTIPDRGYFHLRHNESGSRIGELDEEFVWEAKIGQVFTLSTQNWKIDRITHNDVFVTPARPGSAAPPFWKAEENLRDSHFSERVADFLEAAEELLEDGEITEFLRNTSIQDAGAPDRLMELIRRRSAELADPGNPPHPAGREAASLRAGSSTGREATLPGGARSAKGTEDEYPLPVIEKKADSRLSAPPAEKWKEARPLRPRESLCALQNLDARALERLITFLTKQKEATGGALPHRHHLLVEHTSAGPGGYPGHQIVIHTIWGGRINRPFAMALEAAWEALYGYRPELYPGNDSIVVQLPHEADGGEILSLVTSANFSGLIRKKLEGSGFFGARFRECAGRALLLTRRQINERMPLWVSRLRSQRLLESVLDYDDFPILLEAWRTCLKDELDMERLAGVLAELESGIITWSEAHTSHPSPMAQSVTWPQINQYMYMDDQLKSGKGSKLRSDLLREVVSIPELRPALTVEIAEQFELKRRRLSPGYSPDTPPELVEWVKERLLLPETEWEKLLGAMQRDHDLAPETASASVADRLVRVHPPKATGPLIAALENLPRLSLALCWDIDSLPASRLDTGETFQPLQLREIFSRIADYEEAAHALSKEREESGTCPAFQLRGKGKCQDLQECGRNETGVAPTPLVEHERERKTHLVDTPSPREIGDGSHQDCQKIGSDSSSGCDPLSDELLTTIFAEWIQFYAPITLEFARSTLGLDSSRLSGAVEALIDSETLVFGHLLENGRQDRICDNRNYEAMLRLSRASAIPVFSALDIESLQPFVAAWQGLVTPERDAGPEVLFRGLEQLASYPAPVELWETEIFPARLKPYDPSWLDTIIQQSDLRWIGMPGRRIVFSFEQDLDLLHEEGTDAEGLAESFTS
ncbi:MAG: DEAD/DEAH box helicase, partial [Syntrophobacteraceae bacterium]